MKATKFEDIKQDVCIRYDIPRPIDIENGDFPDFYIFYPDDECHERGGWSVDVLPVFIEQCKDTESANVVISWLEFYIDEIKKQWPDA